MKIYYYFKNVSFSSFLTCKKWKTFKKFRKDKYVFSFFYSQYIVDYYANLPLRILFWNKSAFVYILKLRKSLFSLF